MHITTRPNDVRFRERGAIARYWIGESTAEYRSGARQYFAKLLAARSVEATHLVPASFAGARMARQWALDSLRGRYRNADTQWEKVFDTMGSCIIPHGMPRILGGGPGPTEFIVTPEQTTIIWDYMNEMVRIYTDGRPHPAADAYEPTVMGHSIGHWEGSTLVVDTRNMRASAYDRSGAPGQVRRTSLNSPGVVGSRGASTRIQGSSSDLPYAAMALARWPTQ